MGRAVMQLCVEQWSGRSAGDLLSSQQADADVESPQHLPVGFADSDGGEQERTESFFSFWKNAFGEDGCSVGGLGCWTADHGS